jgi:hypothetical protein
MVISFLFPFIGYGVSVYYHHLRVCPLYSGFVFCQSMVCHLGSFRPASFILGF